MQLSVAEKLSVGISALVLGAVLLLLLAFVLLFLAAMCAAFLANYVGITGASAISAGLLVLLAIVLYLKRRSWIVNPVTRFVATLILDTQKD